MKRFMRVVLIMMLALASSSVAALGLGQIEVKSKLGEPLLAEISIISNDPGELEQLRVGLASPETFARVGLSPPEGVVAGLQFVSALDAAGNPVIRVTSSQPITESLLTFLVEVDWGQGRMVREYSTLLDAPRTVSAPLQPQVDAPVVTPSNTILRPPESMVQGAAPDADANANATAEEPAELAASAIATAPTSVATTAVPAAPAARRNPAEVQAGDTLSEIAQQLDLGGNLNQTMIALLRSNPEAFIGGNIHLLKQGVVLRIPDAAEVLDIDAAQAMAKVREQTRAWRMASQPVPQPTLVDGEGEPNPASAAEATTTSAAASGARLQIVPPGASDATRTGPQSGISAGGEGDMVRQQLQQTTETLAARDAQLADMESRIAELEQLQVDQQKLLTMKDSELTAVQQQLAQAQAAEAGGAVSGLPWILAGIGLLVLVLLGVWWSRRRAVAVPKFRVPSTTAQAPSTLASGFPDGRSPSRSDSAPDEPKPLNDNAAAGSEPSPSKVPVGSSDSSLMAGAAAVPVWHAGSDDQKLNRPSSAPATETDFDVDAPGLERLELARAYLELGDRDSARQLLDELVLSGDVATSQQAEQLLREIGQER
ncbi:type IV pilus assembly protein FimV [Lysobacter sp. A286]